MFHRRARRAMTLIELLVVIAIMAVLTGITVGYSKQSRNQILLTTEKAKIAQTIQRAKSLTLAGYTKPIIQPPPCSYGVAVNYPDPNQYIIFKYNLPDCRDVANLTQINEGQITTVDQPYSLAQGVNFKPENENNDNLKYLIFIPPNLTTLIFSEGNIPPSDQPLAIYLETTDQSLDNKIIVNPNGQLSL